MGKRSSKDIFGGKFSKFCGYTSRPGLMARMKCIENREHKCNLVIDILINSADQNGNEDLNLKFIRTYRGNKHADECKYSLTNERLCRAIDEYDQAEFGKTVALIKANKITFSNENSSSIKKSDKKATLELENLRLSMEVDKYKFQFEQCKKTNEYLEKLYQEAINNNQSMKVNYEARIDELKSQLNTQTQLYSQLINGNGLDSSSDQNF